MHSVRMEFVLVCLSIKAILTPDVVLSAFSTMTVHEIKLVLETNALTLALALVAIMQSVKFSITFQCALVLAE